MERQFETDHGARIIRCKCGRVDRRENTATNGGNHLPMIAIAQHFRGAGWSVGANPRKDRCPDCVAARHRRTPRPKQEEPMPASPPSERVVELRSPRPGISEVPPREMTREDRRIVFAKLEEVYVDEKVGYTAGWNDERVSKDLACPRQWVEVIREENFGPMVAAEDPRITALMDRMDAFGRDIDEFRGMLNTLATDAGTIASRATDKVLATSDFGRRLDAMRADLRKLTGRA